MRDPYVIYGGSQDNGSWAVPSFTRDAFGVRNDDTWKMHWGDGMHVEANPDNWREVYTEAENGSFRRYDALTYREGDGTAGCAQRPELRGSDRQEPSADRVDSDRPRGVLRADARRPQLPVQLADAIHRLAPQRPHAVSRREPRVQVAWTAAPGGGAISVDLSNNDPETTRLDTGGLTHDATGAETHATVVSLSESPVVAGLFWAGTDDGNVWVTQERRGGVDEGERRDSRRSGRTLGERRRSVSARTRDGVRVLRRAPK